MKFVPTSVWLFGPPKTTPCFPRQPLPETRRTVREVVAEVGSSLKDFRMSPAQQERLEQLQHEIDLGKVCFNDLSS